MNELRRLGQGIEHGEDWLTITPAPVTPAVIECYADHRIAMSFAVLGCAVPGVTIKDTGKLLPPPTHSAFISGFGCLCRLSYLTARRFGSRQAAWRRPTRRSSRTCRRCGTTRRKGRRTTPACWP